MRDMPATMAEAMQAMMPIVNKRMEVMKERLQQEITDMVAKSQKNSSQSQRPLTK